MSTASTSSSKRKGLLWSLLVILVIALVLWLLRDCCPCHKDALTSAPTADSVSVDTTATDVQDSALSQAALAPDTATAVEVEDVPAEIEEDILPPSFSVNHIRFFVSPEAGKKFLLVTSTADWQIVDRPSSFFSLERKGDLITIHYSANRASSSRADFIELALVSDPSSVLRVRFAQAGVRPKVAPKPVEEPKLEPKPTPAPIAPVEQPKPAPTPVLADAPTVQPDTVVTPPSYADIPHLTFCVKGMQDVEDICFDMVFVEGGKFTMGATGDLRKGSFPNERPAHKVTLSDFHIAETEVTQILWEAVMGSNPSQVKGPYLPVDGVNWDDCVKFINLLNKRLADQLQGRRFALPTEAQWEYAARGGKRSQGYLYSGSNTLDDVAWYESNAMELPHPVKGKQPNELGIYDMTGNAPEWCADYYGDYESGSLSDPKGPKRGRYRVIRGGSWYDTDSYCRTTCRNCELHNYSYTFSLRLVLLPK